ncbi:MAG: hypothetical protein JWO58_963 [Chitinophagaceae bacterium]|nr:hypothetical protein [Chitinophagaceae bacterium]
MKNRYSYYSALLGILFCLNFQLVQAQNVPENLGKCSNLVDQFNQKTSAANLRGESASVSLKVSSRDTFMGIVSFSKSENGGNCVIGQLENVPNSSFFISVNATSLHGHILFMDTKQAYKYSSDESGNAYVQAVDINQVLCIDYSLPAVKKSALKVEAVVNTPAIFTLESLPGAPGCLYLDFDGETVSGTAWNNGATIVAAPSNMTDDQIRETWEIVSEDYRAFNLNVTTNVNVFNTYPKNMRMKHITTTSKDVTTTGVAYLGSFTWNDDTPSWGTYTDQGKIAGEVAAHELGHTFNLSHDGREINGIHEEYFAGNDGALAAPIMGAGYYNPVTQWSKGDYYATPSNTQDDLTIISGTPGIGYRTDNQGNTTATAAALVVSSSGAVSADQNAGVIEKTTDLDFFSFTTSGGTVQLNVTTVARDGDLNIEVKLYNQSGGLVNTFSPAGVVDHAAKTRSTNLNATVSQSVAAGTYYISVNGVGDLDPFGDGYSEYASLGSYTISGTVPNVAITLRTPENPANTGAGLDYKYYEGNWTAVPNFSTLTPVKTGTISTPDISVRNRDDQFGFSYTGYISVPTDGSYTFYTSSDDGSQLLIGTTLVVNNDGLHGAQEVSGTIGLKAGKHAITVLFFEQGGDQVLQTSYAGPGINKQTIPASAFFRMIPVITRATIYQHCNYDASGYAVGLDVGNYTTAQMAAKGILNNDVSSLKVNSGYEVVLYDLDNFQGASQTFSADNSCLVNNNINDWASSIIVRVATVTPPPPANVPPTVSLIAPTNTAYTAPASITISANANDSDGTISKVDFYYGSTLISSDNSSPYSISWTGVAVGTYSITAKATDNAGAVTTSSAISVVVTNPVTTNSCTGVAQYTENGGYNAGSKVQANGSQYQCKPWPYSGWCNGAAWAYGPGTGTYWTDAWTLVGSCNSASVASGRVAEIQENTLTNSPNPFAGVTNIDVTVTEAGNVSVKVYDKTGKVVAILSDDYLDTGKHTFELNGSNLSPDMYIVRYESNSQVIVRKIVKAQ